MAKEEFLKLIQNGKWFHIQGKRNQSFLVKMKSVTYPEIDTFIETLWLSNDEWESMCFADYDSESWNLVDDQFISYSSSIYHFGSTDGPVEDSIYTENGYLDEVKMKKDILNHAKKEFITPEELNESWEKVKQKNFSEFQTLMFK